MNDDPTLLCYIQQNSALGKRAWTEHYSIQFNKYLQNISFVLSDRMDLDMYLGLTPKDAALQNTIFCWELIGGLPDVRSGFMKSTSYTQPSEEHSVSCLLKILHLFSVYI